MTDETSPMESIKLRLDEILSLVKDDELPFDETLSLYEEAVKLGTEASDLVAASMEEASEESVEEDGVRGI